MSDPSEIEIQEIELTERPERIQPTHHQRNNAVNSPEDMHNLTVTFGRHHGTRWTRLPLPYLKWLANQGRGEPYRLSMLELKRRGITVDFDVELTAHAVDKASIRLIELWQETRITETEGLYTWLARNAQQAWDKLCIPIPEAEQALEKRSVLSIDGEMKMVFLIGRFHPVLKTVSRVER